MRISRVRHPHLGRLIVAWGAVAAFLFGMPALAQTASSTVTTGFVVDLALSGSSVRNLDFASMAPGSPKSVVAQDAQTCADGCTSGKWLFQNLSGRNADRRANVQFAALPDSLVGPGGAKLAVAYTSRACVYLQFFNFSLGCITQGVSTQGSTIVVPINNIAGAIGDGLPIGRDLDVWIGGTASPMPGQRAGDYTGVITVYFFYN